jgi:TonB family protein
MKLRPASWLVWLLLAVPTAAQEAPPAQPQATPAPLTWQRITADEEFAIDFPSNFAHLLDNPNYTFGSNGQFTCTGWRTISSYLDGLVMMVEFYTVNEPNGAMSEISSRQSGFSKSSKKETALKPGKIRGREIIQTSGNLTMKRQYFALQSKVVLIMTIAAQPDNPVAQHFWESLQVGKLTKPSAPPPDALLVNNSAADETATTTAKNATRKAVILWKTEPPYTDEARKSNISGTVMVRVLLGASGQVTKVTPLTRLPYGLTELALSVAARIKFIPAEYQGKRVSQWVTVEYEFRVY